ncbi:MAG: death-on-curing family protein [Acidobacteria bacterium 13_1_20CM_58_21]|nr:MAG: death-on-curing family protein [Acidobacteria bacterium 13_1_20CM_58_21]
MAQRVYLTVAEVLAIHHRQIESYGGSHGLRDVGALEAAVFRPQIGYYNSPAEEAAALMESLVNNHPFLDGNKPVAFDASHTFLLMNGFTIEADPVETYAFMVDAIAEGRFRFPVILDWLSAHIKPL